MIAYAAEQTKKAQAIMAELNKPRVIHGEVSDKREEKKAEDAEFEAKLEGFEEKKRKAFEKNKTFRALSRKKKTDINKALPGDEAFEREKSKKFKGKLGEATEAECPFTSLKGTEDQKLFR